MANVPLSASQARPASIITTNSVIKNTYLLLGSSLLFSAVIAYIAMKTQAPSLGLASLLVYFGLIYFIQVMRNSYLGIIGVFALTGMLGYTLGPILNYYLHAFVNGNQLVLSAIGGTGVIFFSLSAYALSTRQNFNYLGGFLLAASMALLVGIVIQLFYPAPMLQVIMSMGFMLFSSGIILFETSRIIHGGQDNYILATVQIFVALYNLFLSLLQILSFFGGQRD